ncbi:MAG: HlyD family type I secretion periplasmic adaptor subunit [Burkholderiales bacterium]|nr:MAG: HlyD family type I secretion periplasmic adaptor subunit [Burkholderiales bacterium]
MRPAADRRADGAPNPFAMNALALHAQPPAWQARSVSLAICAFAGLALAFASLTHIDIVVSTQGRVIPSGKSKVVQPLEAGIVKMIAVRDGQSVKAGDVLIELDPTAAIADQERLRREHWEGAADAARSAALLNGTAFDAPKELPPEIRATAVAMLSSRQAEQQSRLAALDADIARRQADRDAIDTNLTQLRATLPLVRKKHEMRVELARTGHIAETGLIETQLEVMNIDKEIAVQGKRLTESEAGLQSARQQRSQAQAEYRSRAAADLAEASRKRESAQQELIKAEARQRQQVLRAPIDGVVQQLAVSTVGGVVTPAQPLMTVVPEHSALEVEAQVANRDIGQLRVGQRVIAKVETFDFTRWGYIEGHVQWIGTDAVLDQKLGAVYPVRIQLESTQTPNAVGGRHGVVTAGMSITADIRTGERRLIDYFLAPMLRAKDESLRER